MSSDFLTTSVSYWGIVAASDFGSAYAAYLALSVWRGLSVPIYRSRALWTGILAVFFGLGFPVSGNVSELLPPNYTFVAVILAYFILFPSFVIAFFAWVDRTVTMLIRLDYLRRDLVWWSKLRWAFRAFAGATVVRAWLSAYNSPSIFAITPGSEISVRQQFFSDIYLNILFLVSAGPMVQWLLSWEAAGHLTRRFDCTRSGSAIRPGPHFFPSWHSD